MPWKLVAFLSALIVAAFFIGFNLDNRCDVSVLFHTFRNVPICVSLLVAFVVGAIAVIPFFVSSSIRKTSSRAKTSRARTDRSRTAARASGSRTSRSPASDLSDAGDYED